MSKRYNLSLSAEELLVFGALTSYSVAALDKDEEAQAGMFLTLTIFKPEVPHIMMLLSEVIEQAKKDMDETFGSRLN